MLSAENLLARLAQLDERTLRLLDAAERGRDLRTALAAIHESRGNIESYARLIALGQLLETNANAPVPVDTPSLPTPSTDSIRAILKTLIAGGAANAKDGTEPEPEPESETPDEHQRPAAG